MSLFGTVVNGQKTDAENAACPQDAAPETCSKPVVPYEPIISAWDKLLYPAKYTEGGLEVYTCGNNDCTSVAKRTMPFSEWGGVEAMVNMALFGSTDANDVSSWSSDSLIGAYHYHVPISAGTLSANASRMVSILPFPVITMLNEVQYINGAPDMIGNILARSLPDYFAYQIGVEMLSIGQGAFSGQTKTEMPASYRANLTEKARALANLREKSSESTP